MSGMGYTLGTLPARIGAVLSLLLVATLVPLTGVSAAQVDPLATRVQILHAATGLGQVEVHINGQEELDEFEYGDVSDWITLDAGTVRVTITYDRAGFNYAAFDGGYPVPAGNDYYLVISDALMLAGAFDRTAVPADTGRVQFTQASVDTPAMNVVISGADQSVPISYPKTSEAIELPTGTYDLDFQLQDTGESVGTLTGFTVSADTSYQLVTIGDPTSEDKPFEVKVLETATSAGGEATPVASPEATPAG